MIWTFELIILQTFIFVRPPPSKSNHPLNLQVQLVPPNSRPPNGVVSKNGEPTTPNSSYSAQSSDNDGASLARTNSNRSEASIANSYGGSTTSFASVASGSTSTSSRRAIIPLYNLQAHNVLTNVIVDAGTDAKIAKFQKRGIELIDLALLEPVEVWGEKDREKEAKRESMRLSVDEMGAMLSTVPTKGSIPSARGIGSLLPPGNGQGSRPTTPSAASSAASLHSGSRSSHGMSTTPATPPRHPVPDLVPEQPTPVPANPLKRNIFKSLFNKKSNTLSASPSAVPPEDTLNSFGAFSLHPAPTTKITSAPNMKKALPPPPLPLLEPPTSPSSISSQATPTEPHTPRQADIVSPTPTVAPPKEKGHSRNQSLTSVIATSFKTPLRGTKKRSSNVAMNSEFLSPTDNIVITEPQSERRNGSPNPSMTRSNRSNVSLRGSMNFDAGSTHTKDGSSYPGGYPLMLTQSQAREELTSLKQQQLQLRPPILGIQPTFVSAALAPPTNASNTGITSPLVAALSPRMSESNPESLLQGQRALMYVWLVRKWLKRRPSVFSESGLFGGLGNRGGRHSGDSSSPPPALTYGGVEVRFEWKRAKNKEGKGSKGGKKRRGRRPSRKFASGDESDDGVRDRDGIGEPLQRIKSEERKARRLSSGTHSTQTASEDGVQRRDRSVDPGDSSDPEDSETPWVCTLKMRRNISTSNPSATANYMLSPAQTAASAAGTFPPQVLRVKVGTLSPTPHHPKVVAMLKVPFPLPDVQVDRMKVLKRNGTPMNQDPSPSPSDAEPYHGITLSAEEIKDMVCSTGLWLVVREGFGGVGRVSRKGDGWRIRA